MYETITAFGLAKLHMAPFQFYVIVVHLNDQLQEITSANMKSFVFERDKNARMNTKRKRFVPCQ